MLWSLQMSDGKSDKIKIETPNGILEQENVFICVVHNQMRCVEMIVQSRRGNKNGHIEPIRAQDGMMDPHTRNLLWSDTTLP